MPQETVKIVYWFNHQDTLDFDFSFVLHRRGKDVTFYKNQFDSTGQVVHDSRDSDFLRKLAFELFSEPTGVTSIRANPYGVQLLHSKAVDQGDLVDLVVKVAMKVFGDDATIRAEKTVVELPA